MGLLQACTAFGKGWPSLALFLFALGQRDGLQISNVNGMTVRLAPPLLLPDPDREESRSGCCWSTRPELLALLCEPELTTSWTPQRAIDGLLRVRRRPGNTKFAFSPVPPKTPLNRAQGSYLPPSPIHRYPYTRHCINWWLSSRFQPI